MFAIVYQMTRNNSVSLNRYLMFRGFRGSDDAHMWHYISADRRGVVTNAPTFRIVLLFQSAVSVHFCQSTRRHNPQDSCFYKMRLLNLTRFCVQELKFITSDCLLSNTVVESFQIRMSHTQNEMQCPYTLSRCFISTHMLGRF